MHRLRALVDSDLFRSSILLLILLNAFAMGLEATPDAAAQFPEALEWFFLISQILFVAEIAARWLAAPPGEFFKDSWNTFDFLVVAISLAPIVGGSALIVRTFRILRVLRVVSVADVMWGKAVRTEDKARATGFALLLMLVAGYIIALLGFHLLADEHVQWSSLARSVATLLYSFTPGGIAALVDSAGPAVLLHAAFYVVVLSIVLNLILSIVRPSTDTRA